VLHEDSRQRLTSFLEEVRNHAPTLHMSFSADPSPAFTQRLITWLRSEIHPIVLLQVGLQPNIGAGSVVRTTNKYFDFSLRSRFKQKGDVLAQLLKEGSVAQ
jgi:F0F1-type ATP synthase delta subunit